MGSVTNIKVEPVEISWSGSALGFCDGDIAISIEEQMVDVTAHQEGTNVLTGIRTGKTAEVTVTLKETDSAQITKIFGPAAGGSEYTPMAGTGVIGWGGSKDFTQNLTQASKLVLHPVVLASGDYSRDWAFWKAYPMPDSITFSGENPETISVTFKCYPDLTKQDAVRLFVYGNHTQNFDAV